MKILAIEDDPDFAEWCRRMLASAEVDIDPDGFKVRPRLDAGVEYAREFKPALIFLDLNLEDTRGAETVSGIPELDKIAPVIIVSGITSHSIDSQLLQKCYQAGAVGHIFKKHLKPMCSEMVAGIIVAGGYNWRRIHFSGNDR